MQREALIKELTKNHLHIKPGNKHNRVDTPSNIKIYNTQLTFFKRLIKLNKLLNHNICYISLDYLLLDYIPFYKSLILKKLYNLHTIL